MINDRLIDAGELPLAVRDFGGDRPPLLLLHGFGGNLAHMTTLARQLELSADPTLASLLTELRDYPGGESEPDPQFGGVVVPLRLRTEAGTLSMFTTTTVFGTPVEVTLSELMLEAFYPADEFTAGILRQMATTPQAA